jgi:hypothetical protein
MECPLQWLVCSHALNTLWRRLDLDTSGAAAVSAPLMQTQQGPLTSLSYADRMPGAVATGCQDGTLAIWNTQVCSNCFGGDSRLSVLLALGDNVASMQSLSLPKPMRWM